MKYTFMIPGSKIQFVMTIIKGNDGKNKVEVKAYPPDTQFNTAKLN